MNSREDRSLSSHSAQEEVPHEPILGIRAGRLTGYNNSGALLVDFEGNTAGPVAARLAVAADANTLQAAVTNRQPVVLMFEHGDPRRPFIMGMIQEPSATPLLDSLLEIHTPTPRPPLEACVDGKRVIIEGKEEICLVCGESSITLRRDGRIMVKGRSVETRATGRNRVKGGVVEIN